MLKNYSGWLRALAFFCLVAVTAAPAVARNNSDVPPRDDGVMRQLSRDSQLSAADGGKLNSNINNVIVDYFGECRWLDNNSTQHDYFIPTGNSTDWLSFIDNAPSLIRIDNCCPATTVTLNASDGTPFSFNLPVGRENSTGPLGVTDLSHVFNVVDGGTGASWTETVSVRYTCESRQWTSGTVNTVGGPGSWDIGAWGACSADCEGTQTRTVVCRDSGGAEIAEGQCGAKPATSRACGAATCDVSASAGVCGTAVGRYFDRNTPPPAAQPVTLCAEGAVSQAPFRKDAITWEWSCRGADNVDVPCRTHRTGAAKPFASDCRPPAVTTPSALDFQNSNQWYTYVCGVDRRMPKNQALSPAHWQIPQMVNNYSGEYSCAKAGMPVFLGARTAGDDWHKAYYTHWKPYNANELDNPAGYYQNGRGDQCEGCVVLKTVYCSDEPDYPRECAPVTGLTYVDLPPPNCVGREFEYDDGSLPAGYYGQVKYLEDSEFTCGLNGWVNTGYREEPYNPMQQGHTQRCF